MKISSVVLAIYLGALALFSASPETTQIENLIGVILAVVFFFEYLISRDKLTLPWHRSIVFLLLYLALSFVMVLFFPESFRRLITFILSLILFYVVFGIVRQNDNLSLVITGLGIGLGVLIYQNIDQIILLSQGLSRVRFDAGFNANEFSYILLIFVLLLVNLLMIKKFKFNLTRWFILLAIILAGYFIIFTGSRKGIILLSVVIIYLIFVIFKDISIPKKILFVGSLSFGGIALFNWFAGTPFFYRIENLFLLLTGQVISESSVDLRAGMVETGIELWVQKPFLGWGFDSFRYLSGFDTYSHNNYVEILTNTGLVGFILYHSFYFYLIVLGFKKYRLTNDSDVKRKISWAFLGLFILMSWSFGAVSYTSKMNWILTGIILATITKKGRE